MAEPKPKVETKSEERLGDPRISIQDATERGFYGEVADPTPNRNNTLAGVTDPNTHVPEEFKQKTGEIVFPDVPDGVKA